VVLEAGLSLWNSNSLQSDNNIFSVGKLEPMQAVRLLDNLESARSSEHCQSQIPHQVSLLVHQEWDGLPEWRWGDVLGLLKDLLAKLDL
jgi:hypothetical protein